MLIIIQNRHPFLTKVTQVLLSKPIHLLLRENHPPNSRH